MASVFLSICVLFLISTVSSVSTVEKQKILDIHNELRDRVAGGGLTSDGHPAATNMNFLIWDDGLEAVAQAYVDDCVYAHNSDRNTDYLTQAQPPNNNVKWTYDNETACCEWGDWPTCNVDCIKVGENLAASSGTYTIDDIVSKIETGWFDEYEDWTFGNVNTGCPSGKQCKHYTQMVWATTRYIGCAYKTGCPHDPANNQWRSMLVCNYFPAGNWNGQKPYEDTTGTSCSNCMNDRPLCFSDYISRSNTAGDYNNNNPYDALCGGGVCKTKCNGASTSTCSGACSSYTADCTDGTETNGRDVCVTPAPTPATSAPTLRPTTSPTQPTAAPTGPPACITISNDGYFDGDWQQGGTSNTKPYYTKTVYGTTFYLEWTDGWLNGKYAIKTSLGSFSVYEYCNDETVITDCTAGSWNGDADMTVSGCSQSAQNNDEQQQSGELQIETVPSSGNVDTYIFNMTEMHIILSLLIIVLLTMCGMIIGFCWYIKNKNKNENKNENAQKMEMVYFESKDNQQHMISNHSTPTGDVTNANIGIQSSLKVNVRDKKMMKKTSQTTPVTPLMEDEQIDGM